MFSCPSNGAAWLIWSSVQSRGMEQDACSNFFCNDLFTIVLGFLFLFSKLATCCLRLAESRLFQKQPFRSHLNLPVPAYPGICLQLMTQGQRAFKIVQTLSGFHKVNLFAITRIGICRLKLPTESCPTLSERSRRLNSSNSLTQVS